MCLARWSAGRLARSPRLPRGKVKMLTAGNVVPARDQRIGHLVKSAARVFLQELDA